MSNAARWVVLVLATALLVGVSAVPWHPDANIRKAAGLVLATLLLWISEIAPLGVVAMGIPIFAALTGLLGWKQALAAWGDPVVFLFLGAFLLARALDKHGVFDRLLHAPWMATRTSGDGVALTLSVLLIGGALSTLQNNTAVTAMLLPIVAALARRVRRPALPLLGLAYGSTFGGMATPVGTAPNFLGYAAMKAHDATVGFISWLAVGIPVWLGVTLIGFAVLSLSRFVSRAPTAAPPSELDLPATELGPQRPEHPPGARDRALAHVPAVRRATAGRWALAAFLGSAAAWLTIGFIVGFVPAENPIHAWVAAYLPESVVPVAAALVLFMIRADGSAVLDRRDFQALDWDTLFLIAGGLCLGTVLEQSGAANALAQAVARADLPPLLLMFALGGVTVLLSEMTSNTATAALMVPIAAALAGAIGMSPVKTIYLVALSASLGFALPVSTPPNAIVYGTRMVPLRLMAGAGIVLDVLALAWVVLCVRWFAGG